MLVGVRAPAGVQEQNTSGLRVEVGHLQLARVGDRPAHRPGDLRKSDDGRGVGGRAALPQGLHAGMNGDG